MNRRSFLAGIIPSLNVKADGIIGTFAEREDLLRQLLDQIKQYHEKINS